MKDPTKSEREKYGAQARLGGYTTKQEVNSTFPRTRELTQPRRRRQQKPHKFAYLTMKNSIFARFARAFTIFWHFEDVLVLSMTWNDLFCSCVGDVSIWQQMFNFVFLCPKRGLFQFNSRTVITHFLSIMTLNNRNMIAETRGYIFRWRSRLCRRRVGLSSLLTRVACPPRFVHVRVIFPLFSFSPKVETSRNILSWFNKIIF